MTLAPNYDRSLYPFKECPSCTRFNPHAKNRSTAEYDLQCDRCTMGSKPDRYDPVIIPAQADVIATEEPIPTPTKKIIALSGLIGSGKDTVGEILQEEGYTPISFAGVLKDITATLFGWDRAMIEGTTPDGREQRTVVDEWWADKLGDPEFTPRKALQVLGTDVLRNNFCDSIWLYTVERKLQEVDKAVITDCRFPNELEAMSQLGAYTVRITRGQNPEWYEIAKRYNNLDERQREQARTLSMSPDDFGIHASEYSLVGVGHKYTLDNNGSLDDLKTKVLNMIA